MPLRDPTYKHSEREQTDGLFISSSIKGELGEEWVKEVTAVQSADLMMSPGWCVHNCWFTVLHT